MSMSMTDEPPTRPLTIPVTSGEGQNPFRSHVLNESELAMYRDLLNRPLPRLPKLYTLPSRLLHWSLVNCILASYSLFIVYYRGANYTIN